MPWLLFDRFIANGKRLLEAVKNQEPTAPILEEQRQILREWQGE